MTTDDALYRFRLRAFALATELNSVRLDRHYEALRIQMQTLFADLGLATAA